MRLTFPDAQHADVGLASGRVVIGSDPECDVRLQHSSISRHHASVDRHPQRGVSLAVLDRGASVHVNGRPVGEYSFLRAGDCITVGTVRIEVVAECEAGLPAWAKGEPPAIEPQAASAATRVVLRGVSGKYFGRSIGLLPSLVVGSAPEAGISLDDAGLAAQHARLEIWPNAVVLRELSQGDGTRVNGQAMRSAEIRHGDQVVFEQHRFVLEAPGLPAQAPARRPITGVHEAVPEAASKAQASADATASAPRSSHTLWWLLGAAALIAAVFAGLMY